jgi:hypothetical protein
MNNKHLIVIFSIFFFLIPRVGAEPILVFDLSPESQYNQLWAYQTYHVNISIHDFNISSMDMSGFTGKPTGLLFNGSLQWKGKGGYDFGGSTTGYTYILEEIPLGFSSHLEVHSVLFNITLDKDAFDYGMKPFEIVELFFKLNVYVILEDDSIGPKVTSKSLSFILVDDLKISYLEGKYSDMSMEINPVIDVPDLNSFNRKRFQQILDSMNESLGLGDYVEALDIWEDYDEDDRLDLILGLVRASNDQYNELVELENIEDQLEEIETQLSLLEEEYKKLEITYTALANTYSKVNTDLESTKNNLTTSRTAIILVAILFYFLGRRGLGREDV